MVDKLESQLCSKYSFISILLNQFLKFCLAKDVKRFRNLQKMWMRNKCRGIYITRHYLMLQCYTHTPHIHTHITHKHTLHIHLTLTHHTHYTHTRHTHTHTHTTHTHSHTHTYTHSPPPPPLNTHTHTSQLIWWYHGRFQSKAAVTKYIAIEVRNH